MVYLVTGRRTDDGWPFAGEVMAGTGAAAADLVRRWGVEPDFVQDVASGRIELRVDDTDGDDDGGEDGASPSSVRRIPVMSLEAKLS